MSPLSFTDEEINSITTLASAFCGHEASWAPY